MLNKQWSFVVLAAVVVSLVTVACQQSIPIPIPSSPAKIEPTTPSVPTAPPPTPAPEPTPTPTPTPVVKMLGPAFETDVKMPMALADSQSRLWVVWVVQDWRLAFAVLKNGEIVEQAYVDSSVESYSALNSVALDASDNLWIARQAKPGAYFQIQLLYVTAGGSLQRETAPVDKQVAWDEIIQPLVVAHPQLRRENLGTVWAPLVSFDGDALQLLFMAGSGSIEGPDTLYRTSRAADGRWSPIVAVGSRPYTPGQEHKFKVSWDHGALTFLTDQGQEWRISNWPNPGRWTFASLSQFSRVDNLVAASPVIIVDQKGGRYGLSLCRSTGGLLELWYSYIASE